MKLNKQSTGTTSSLITNEYIRQNAKLHEQREGYGVTSEKWVDYVKLLCEKYNTKDVLDYGCGKGKLQEGLDFPIQSYDPCIEKHSQRPRKADIVICTDVLEHIEPELLENVLWDIHGLTGKVVFLTISTRKAAKTLPDGRNAHLIVEKPAWWFERLDMFNPIETTIEHDEVHVLARKVCSESSLDTTKGNL